MKRIRSTTIFPTLLLFVLALHTISYSLLLPSFELTSFQKTVSTQVTGTDSLTAGESDEQSHEDDFKPPKNSFIDYSTFLSPSVLFPAYTPSVSSLLTYEPFQALPQVFLEIVVPPDHA